MLAALEKGDEEQFTEAVTAFDAVGLLDEFKTTMLLRIKKTIVQEDESLA